MITLEEAKDQLVISHNDDDPLLVSLISTVSSQVANYTNRVIESAEQVDVFDGFSTPLVLKSAPFISITSIEYQDSDDATQTLASYTVDSRGTYAEITPVYGDDWPTTHEKPQSVTVTYQAGYSGVPEPLRQAALMLLSSLYEQRENHIVGVTASKVPVSAEYLMTPYRIPVL